MKIIRINRLKICEKYFFKFILEYFQNNVKKIFRCCSKIFRKEVK
nr:MAG TPA: hypothetical protein [Caudoviricetes sp.]